MATRFLRGKAKRNALWIAANGKCQICGCDLPEAWHADHIEPYCQTQQTNLHDMQALCPSCNLKKGSTVLRSHQQDALNLATRIVAGAIPFPDFACAHVCPGGGKSVLPVLFAYWLIQKGDLAEKICWVVPNGSLRDQAVDAFRQDALGAKLFAHSLEIVSSTNNQNPSKGLAGYVTTYHALLRDSSGINADDFRKHRYLLVLDEFHHCALNGPFHKAVEPLVSLSAFTLLMTGTLDRNDRQPVYALPYGFSRKVEKDISDTTFRWVNYSIKGATREKAIIRTRFFLREAKSKWYDQEGQIQEAEALGSNRNALFTALRTEFAFELLDECASNWIEFRKDHPRSKLLVVCADIAEARKALNRLRRNGINSDIATCKDEEPDSVIEAFRTTDFPHALVTVAKAYEGMDVPRVTHIACLTHIRSRPWIEQMIARGWRFDSEAGPWEHQFCIVYAPADDAFRKCVRDIEDEQQEAIASMGDVVNGNKKPAGSDSPSPIPPAEVTPIASMATDCIASELHGESLSAEDTEFYRSVAEQVGAKMHPLQAKAFLEEALRRRSDGWTPPRTDQQLKDPDADERIRLLSTQLNNLVRSLASGDGEECARINTQLKRIYGPRDGMDEKNLRDAIAFLRRTYSNRLHGIG